MKKRIGMLILLIVGVGILGVVCNYAVKLMPEVEIEPPEPVSILNTTISAIIKDPEAYIEKDIAIIGEYRGWQSEEGYGPPVTRSDWVIRDESGEIYVTGKLPGLDPVEDIGKKIKVKGVVKIGKNSRPYIEARELVIQN